MAVAVTHTDARGLKVMVVWPVDLSWRRTRRTIVRIQMPSLKSQAALAQEKSEQQARDMWIWAQWQSRENREWMPRLWIWP